MAEASAHTSGALMTALIGGSVAASTHSIEIGLAFFAWCLIGEILLSPDLDDGHGDRPYKRWGIFRFVWYPYQRLLKHRSPLTHWPILGTAGRVIYLGVIPGLVAHWCGVNLAGLFVLHETWILAALGGLEASNSTHFVLDHLP